MATKKTDLKNKGRTTNFIPYDPNTDEERSPASSYLPPTPTPVKKLIDEDSYEAERKVETEKPTPPPAPPYDQPPTFTPPERLDTPVETYSPDTADQPPSFNVRQYEYAKEARGDQPPSFSIPTPPPLPTFDDTSEPSAQDIEDLNRAKQSYNEQAEKIADETKDFNRLIDEQTFRVDGLNEIAEEIEKEVGLPPVNISEVKRREAQLIAQQNDLDDRYNKFALNPYGDVNEQGYYIDAENMIAEQELINEEVASIFQKYENYNDWVNASNQPDIKSLRNQYELKLNELNNLNNVISQKGFELNQDIENSSRLYDVLDIRENELSAYTRNLESQYDPVRRNLLYGGEIDPYNELSGGEAFIEIEKPKQIDELALSEKAIEALNQSPKMSEFYYDPDPNKGGFEAWQLNQETGRYEKFIPSVTEAEERFIEQQAQSRPLTGVPAQDTTDFLEVQKTDFEPDTFFSRNPIKITTGDIFNPLNMTPLSEDDKDLLYEKINNVEDKALEWLDKNIGEKEIGGILQDSIYNVTKEGNKALYSAGRILRGEQDIENFIADVKKARTEAERIKALGDWGESAFSPQAGTVIEFLDIPYYYNQIKKLDDIVLVNFDGDKTTDITDIDDYLLAFGTLGGLTLKDRGIRTPDIGYVDDLLELQGRVLTKYIGQSPETYRTADFWLSSPLAELPKHDPIKALRREDEFINRAVFGDVLFPSAETGRVLERFEDENGNPPKDFSWGLKKANNWLGFEVDEEAIKSERYKELLPYLQARAEDDYIRPLDLIFTVAEVATAYPTARFAGTLAVRPLKKGYKFVSKKVFPYLEDKGFTRNILNNGITPAQVKYLKSTPDEKLTGDQLAMKKLMNIEEANIKIDKLKDRQILTNGTLELLELPTKVKTGNLKNWLSLNLVPKKYYEKTFNNIQNKLDEYNNFVYENSLEGQLSQLNNKSLLSAQDMERRDYILFLQDLEIDKKYINEAVKKKETPQAKKLRKQTEILAQNKKYHDVASTIIAGTNPTPNAVDLKSQFMADISARPMSFFKLPNDYDPKNKYFNQENINLATSRINEIFDDKSLSLGEQADNLNLMYEDLIKLNPDLPRELELDSFYQKFKAHKKNDMDALTFEDIKIGWQTRLKNKQLAQKRNLDTYRNSNKKFSPELKNALDNLSDFYTQSLLRIRRAPLGKIKDPDRSTIKAEQALIGEKITLPKSFIDGEKIRLNKKKVTDGSQFEEEAIGKKLDQDPPKKQKEETPPAQKSIDSSNMPEAPKLPPFDVPRTNEPDTTKTNEPERLRDPERLREPDTKRLREPDAGKAKKVREPDSKKQSTKEPDSKKMKEADTTKRKKAKDPKKLREPEKIKEPDAKKKKKKRIKNKDASIPPTGEVDQDAPSKQIKKDFPALIQWKDGEKYYTYNLNTNETKEREFPILGGVKAGDTPEKSVKIIKRSSTRPKFFKKKIGNLSLQIKSPTVVTVKKLENNLYNKTKPINFRN